MGRKERFRVKQQQKYKRRKKRKKLLAAQIKQAPQQQAQVSST